MSSWKKLWTLQVVQWPELCHQIILKGFEASLSELAASRSGLLDDRGMEKITQAWKRHKSTHGALCKTAVALA